MKRNLLLIVLLLLLLIPPIFAVVIDAPKIDHIQEETGSHGVIIDNDLYIQGNVGIGTSTPSYPLSIQAGSSDTRVLFLDQETNDYTGTTDNVGLYLDKTISTSSSSTVIEDSVGIRSSLVNSYILSGNTFDELEQFTTGLRNTVSVTGNHSIDMNNNRLNEENYGISTTLIRSGILSPSNLGSSGIENYGTKSQVTDSMSFNSAGETINVYNYGARFTVLQTGTETAGTLIKDNYGVYSIVGGNTSGTTTNYGLYTSVSGADTNYGLYSASDVPSYFAGDVGIGTTAPSEELEVVGDIDISGDTPHLLFYDSDTDDGYEFHLDTDAASAPWNNFTLWRTDANGVNPDTPLMYFDNSNNVVFPTGAIEIPTTTSTTGLITQDGGRFIHSYGSNNIFVGSNSGNFTTTGAGGNMGFGADTLTNLTSGTLNMAIGTSALNRNTTGGSNVAVGRAACFRNVGGSQNVGLGRNSLFDNVSGLGNVAIGYYTLNKTLASYNTAVGVFAGFSNVNGGSSVFIGRQAGYYETASNKLFIDNVLRASEADGRAKALIYGVFAAAVADQDLIINADVGIGTTAPTEALDVNGRIELTQQSGSTNDGALWNDSTQKALQTYVSGIEQTLTGCIFTQTADQTIANTTTETTLFGSGVGTLTLPANFWTVGKTIRIEIHGDFADTGNPTAEVQAYYGATSLIDSGAITLSGLGGTEEWETEVVITCRTAGASGALQTIIDWEYETTTGSSPIERLDVAGVLTSPIDLTASGALDVTFQWGTAAAANTIHSHVGFVEVLN